MTTSMTRGPRSPASARLWLRAIAIVLTVGLVLAAAPLDRARAQAGPSKEAVAAADRLIVAQDFDALMKDMATQAATQIPAQHREAFIKAMTDPARLERIKHQTRLAMAKHMSVAELDALSEFYSKPIARSAMSKMGSYMAELMPFIQKEMMSIGQSIDQSARK